MAAGINNSAPTAITMSATDIPFLNPNQFRVLVEIGAITT